MATDEQPAIVSGSTHTIRTLVDGTMSLTLHIEPRHAQAAFAIFGAPGTPVALARLVPEAAQQAAQQEAVEEQNWGHAYRCLHTKGFFYNPRVVAAFGVSGDADAGTKVRSIKESIYDHFQAESLAEIDPALFSQFIDGMGLGDALPPDFVETAMGGAV